MTLAEQIRTLYRPPVEYTLAGTERTITLCKPTQIDVGRILAKLQDDLPNASKCLDMLREDARLRDDHPDAETAWSQLDLSDRLALQSSLTDFEERSSLAKARLCLRHDEAAQELTDEDIRYLIEGDPGFVDAVNRLCGHDAEDPTGKNDSPLG